MSALPKGWTNSPLLSAVELHDSRRIPLNAAERAKRKGQFPYYGANGLVDHIDSYIFEGKYVLLAEDGGNFDKPERGVAYEVSGKFWVNNHAHILRPRGGTPPRFLRYWLNAIDWMPYVGGTTRAKLTQAGLAQITIPLPPLPEQRKIVAKLDSLTGRTARARGELERIPKLIQKYREAILVAAFKGQLTREWRSSFSTDETAERLVARTAEPEKSRGGREATERVIPGVAGLSVNHPGSDVPSGWAWVRLTRIARQETGHTPSRSRPDYWDGGVPWIGIKDANIHHGRVIDQTLQTISDLGLENSSARLLRTGTVCLSRTASVGYVTIMGRSMATSQDFATWTCAEALLPKYLMYALMAEGDDIRRFGEGSTHTTIYFPEIRALHICLAPKIEQVEIVRRIEAAFAWIDRIVAEYANASRLLPKLNQAILAKAFRGELVLQDPNDKPLELSATPAAEARAVVVA